MSAFCVFGISINNCRKTVEKAMPSHEGKKQLTVQEWKAKCDVKTAALFESADRRRQISPAFDTPEFCDDWISVASNGEIKLPMVMARGAKQDKKGNPVLKDGKPVITWIEYKRQPVTA